MSIRLEAQCRTCGETVATAPVPRGLRDDVLQDLRRGYHFFPLSTGAFLVDESVRAAVRAHYCVPDLPACAVVLVYLLAVERGYGPMNPLPDEVRQRELPKERHERGVDDVHVTDVAGTDPCEGVRGRAQPGDPSASPATCIPAPTTFADGTPRRYWRTHPAIR